jgi:hypothetical protein
MVVQEAKASLVVHVHPQHQPPYGERSMRGHHRGKIAVQIIEHHT